MRQSVFRAPEYIINFVGKRNTDYYFFIEELNLFADKYSCNDIAADLIFLLCNEISMCKRHLPKPL
jgi:hypothetical protein